MIFPYNGKMEQPASDHAFRWAVVLRRILDDRGATPAAALVADLGISSSALHRMLAALRGQGLIVRIGHGRYDAGMALAAAVAGTDPLTQLARTARPPLARLARAVCASVHLGALDGDMATYLVKVAPGRARPDTLFTREGGQLEAYCTGIGKILLASLPDAEQRRYCAGGPFVRLTANTIVDPRQLRAAIRAAGQQGWACDDHEMAEGLYCYALPVRDRDGQTIAAVSMSFQDVAPAFRPSADQIARLQAAVRSIETHVW